jgi:predicted deacylase
VHGDELTGVAICRRLLASKALAISRGTLLVVPIFNAFRLHQP